jgi:hypothetical protein
MHSETDKLLFRNELQHARFDAGTPNPPLSTGMRNVRPRKIQTITRIVIRIQHSPHEVYKMNIRLGDIQRRVKNRPSKFNFATHLKSYVLRVSALHGHHQVRVIKNINGENHIQHHM